MLRKLQRMWDSPNGRLTLYKYVAVGLVVGIVSLFLLTTVVFAVFSLNLPDPNKVVRRDGYSSIIYDRNGKVLYDLYNKEHRIPLELNDIPKDLQHATISIEDKDFYKHQGVDPFSFLRIIRNAVIYRSLTGGSTLTQQLVKNVLLTSERSITRKIKEAILAQQIESKFTKDQILQMYLNEAPYGGASYGVESAAQIYFGKSAKDLTMVQSAILAGFPQLPTVYSPFGTTPKAYVERTSEVLRRMQEDGYITKQQETDALKQVPNIQFASQSGGIKAPHFVFYIKEQLVSMFGSSAVENGGLRVTTTLDLDLQEKAQKIVNEEILKIKKLKVGNGAAVILNPKTGEILSMVGSYDYFAKDYDGQVNVAMSERQPGSSGKPFIYAAAFERNYSPATTLMDVKTDFPSGDPTHPIYTPVNYDGKYRGLIQVRFALGNSINIPAVKMTALVGVKEVMTLGHDAGITTWEPTADNLKNVGLSLALGGREVRLLDLTSAYGTLANAGTHLDPVSILKVTNSKGDKLYESTKSLGKKVLSPEVSFLVSHILSDDNARKDVFGSGSQLVISGKTVAVKTGTTDQKRDNWTLGYTPSRAVGVWVGNNDNTIMNPAVTSGVTGASPIWHRLMAETLKGMPNEDFSKPDSVSATTVDAFSGGLPHGSDPTRVEYFIRGTEPKSVSSIYRIYKVSKAQSNRLANDLEIKLNDYDNSEFVSILESDPVSSDGHNRWQEGINQWISDTQKDNSRYKVPTETSDNRKDSVVIRLESPSDHQKLDSNDVHVVARAFSLRDIVRIKLSVDGSEKANLSGDSVDQTINLPTGPHKITVSADDSGGNSSSSDVNIGVKVDWDSAPASPSARLRKYMSFSWF